MWCISSSWSQCSLELPKNLSTILWSNLGPDSRFRFFFCFFWSWTWLVAELEFCNDLYPVYISFFFFRFWFTINANIYQRDMIKCLFSIVTHASSMSLFTHMFWFYFYSWFYILSEQIFSGTSVSMSSVTTHVLHNSFWKIRPLFGQILITCLKCSRASFLPSFYCRKMRWDPAWVLIPKAITVMLATMMIKILIILIMIEVMIAVVF